MKKLFQDPRKAAAVISAAVIGVVVLIALIILGVKYSDNAPKNDLYLDNIKRTYGTSADVVYARDRLDFTEVELPETVGEYTLNYENSFLVDSNSIVAELCINDKPVGAGVYYIRENELRPLYVLEPDELDSEKRIFPVYADPDYAAVVSTDGPDDLSKPSVNETDKVFVFDLHSMQYAAAYFSDSAANRIGVSHNFVMFDGDLYFDIYLIRNHTTSVYSLDFETHRLSQFSGAGYDPVIYKDDIVYIGSISGDYTAVKGVKLPDFSDDPECGFDEIFTRETIYEFKQSADGEQTLTDLSTGARIFSFETLELLSSNKDHISFTASVYDHQGFIYSMSDNKMLVFGQDEQVIIPKWYECGLGLWLGESNGNKVNAYIISDKDDIQGKTLEYSPLPDDVTALDKYRTYISYVPVVSVEEAVEFTPVGGGLWADDKIFSGTDYWRDEYDPNYKPPMINGYAVNLRLAEYFEYNGRRLRAIPLCRTDDKESEYDYYGSIVEWGYYDPETKGYTTLFNTEEYRDLGYFYSVYNTNEYLIFGGGIWSGYLAVEIGSLDSPDGSNIIKIGEGFDGMKLDSIIVTDDGTAYFSVCDKNGDQKNIYSFDLETGELVILAENVIPVCYSAGRLFYGDYFFENEYYIRSLDGKYSFGMYDVDAYNEYGLYGIRNAVIGGAEYNVFYNMLTDENIFAMAVYPENNVYNFRGLTAYNSAAGIVQLGYNNSTVGGEIGLLYDSANNRVITYDGDKYNFYHSYDGYGVTVYENGERTEYEFSLK